MKGIIFSIPLFYLLVISFLNLSVSNSHLSLKRLPASVETSAKIASEEFQMHCDEVHCPEFIAHIRINNLRVCTGFLIDGNKIMTNHHCIFDVKQNCEGVRIFMNSPDQKNTYEYSCKEVLHLGDDKESLNRLDYAVLELTEHPLNKSVEFNGTDLNVDDEYEVFVTDWNKSNDSLLIKKYDCDPVIDQHIFSNQKFSEHALLAFGNCPIVEGNSGSPIINKETKGLVGILSRNFVLDKGAYSSEFQDVNFDLVSNVGIAINANCFFKTGIEEFITENSFEKCKDIDLSEKNKSRILHQLSMKAFHQVNDYIKDVHITWLKSKSHGVFPYCLTDLNRTQNMLKKQSQIDYQITIPKFRTVMTVSPFFVKSIDSVPDEELDHYKITLNEHKDEEESLIMELSRDSLVNTSNKDLWILRDCSEELDESLASSEI